MSFYNSRAPPNLNFFTKKSKKFKILEGSMYYNYKEEYRKFIKDFNVKKKQMQDAGMSAVDINIMFEFDKTVFNRDRSYNRHKSDYAEDEENQNIVETHINKNICISNDFDDCFSLPEHLDNGVYKTFSVLCEEDKKMLVLHYEKGFTLQEIALLLDVPYQTLKRRHSRAIQKLKKIIF